MATTNREDLPNYNPEQIWICQKPKCRCVTKEKYILVYESSVVGMISQCPQCKSEDIVQSPNLQCPDCEKTYFTEPQSSEGDWCNEGEECPRCKSSPRFNRHSVDFDPNAKPPTLVIRTHTAITFPQQ